MGARAQLWNEVEKFTLTTHQEELADELQTTEDQKIAGEIGAGKTFTVRHYLRSNSIPYEYITATELLHHDQDGTQPAVSDDAEVVAIDNFDVIPQNRDYLEPIYKQFTQLQQLGRAVWLILPSSFDHEWFDTVTRMMINATISKRDINNLTIDEVEYSLDQIVNTSSSVSGAAAIENYGYHTIVNEHLSE